MELFLDANAHLPMSKAAIDAFIDTNASIAGHGHAISPSYPGRAAEAAIERARAEIAEIIGAEIPSQVVFTSTCTQACEWGMEIFRKINKDNPIIYISPTEHPAVIKSSKNNKYNHQLLTLDVNKSGVILNKQNDFPAICIYIQNEAGIIQPIFDLNAKSIFVDMSQAPGKITLPKLKDYPNVDIAVFGAHKFGGPASVGFFYIKNPSDWSEFGYGSRYYLDRAGTPDVCSIVATSAALKDSVNKLDIKLSNSKLFQMFIEKEMKDLGFEIIAENYPRVLNTTFAKVPNGNYSHQIMYELGSKNIHIGLGSACGSSVTGTSALLKILNSLGTANDFIRISQEGFYGESEAKYFISELKKVINA